MQQSDFGHMRPVVEKELLHYDILFALDKEGLLDNLVFQGGTSLRLCFGGNRFSEDLDFAGGFEFTSRDLKTMKLCLEDYLVSRYGLQVIVKEPASLRSEAKYADLNIDKWQISIVTSPDRRDVPRQKIKIEVANVPAHTRIAKPLTLNYTGLPAGYGDLLVMVETLDEIMADKLVSLPATERYVRNRDIWDLAWISQRGIRTKSELVEKKINDYKIQDFQGKLERMISMVPDIVAGSSFQDEMRRFIPSSVYQRTLGQNKFQSYLVDTVSELLARVNEDLFMDVDNSTSTKLPFQM
jgi:predicted nucleotidyltransferase component of viral defense system